MHELNQSTKHLKEEAHFKDLSVHIGSSLFARLHGEFTWKPVVSGGSLLLPVVLREDFALA